MTLMAFYLWCDCHVYHFVLLLGVASHTPAVSPIEAEVRSRLCTHLTSYLKLSDIYTGEEFGSIFLIITHIPCSCLSWLGGPKRSLCCCTRLDPR